MYWCVDQPRAALDLAFFEGVSVHDLFSRGQFCKSFWGDAIEYFDEHGIHVEYAQMDGGDIFCAHHDLARWLDDRQFWDAFIDWLRQENHFVCTQHTGNPQDMTVRTDVDHQRHIATEHGGIDVIDAPLTPAPGQIELPPPPPTKTLSDVFR